MSSPDRPLSSSRNVLKLRVRRIRRRAKAVSSSSSRASPPEGSSTALSSDAPIGMLAANPAVSPARNARTHSVAAMEISRSIRSCSYSIRLSH